MDKKGQLRTCPLNTAIDSTNYEMTKRLKYTKQILMLILTAKSHSSIWQQPSNKTSSNVAFLNFEKLSKKLWLWFFLTIK